jgi:dihydroorotate dehydrogenase (NAD+) catalytic subunit
MFDLSVSIGGIKMKNPVMPASGCFGYGSEYADLIDLNQLGAIVVKGITLEPKQGNPQPRLMETPAGMINSIGLENPGVEVFLKEKLPYLRQFDTPVIVNINGATVEEYIELARILNKVEGIAGLEINISCPNVEKGGMQFGQDSELTRRVISGVRIVTKLPLIAKLTPNVTDIRAIARAAKEAGANAFSLINTVKAMAKLPDHGPNAGKWISGGLSGPCIKPIALGKLSEVVQANLEIPIIGMGGITYLQDALEFFERGADAIAIGTANFVNPQVMPEIIRDLENFMKENQLKNMTELREFLRGRGRR